MRDSVVRGIDRVDPFKDFHHGLLGITGGERAADGGLSEYRNVSVSESHYTVFEQEPEMVRITGNTGPVFTEHWVVTATTVDGRTLAFDVSTGELR